MAHVRAYTRANKRRSYTVIHRGHSYGTYPTKDAAETVRLDVELRQRMGSLYRPAKAETLAGALGRHLARKSRGVKPATARSDREARRTLGPLEPHPIPALTRPVVEDWLDSEAARAPRMAQLSLRLLKAALREAKGRGQQIDDAVLALNPPRTTSARGQVITLPRAYEIGSWLPPHLSRIAPLALLTGLRQGELFALTANDFNGGTLLVRGGKTDAAAREVALCSEAQRLVREQLLARPTGTPFLFPRVEGGRMNKDKFGGYWRRARGDPPRDGTAVPGKTYAAGLPGFRFHWLRHSYITMMRRLGCPVELIAKQVGHKDGGALILRTYRHVLPDEAGLAAQLLDAHLAGASG